MTEGRLEVGRLGEQRAASFLESQGHRVVRRNYRCRFGEIDLVVEGPEGLIFVEVRTKRRPCLFEPEETITPTKARRVAALAEHFLAATHQQDRPWRVDVVAVELDRGDRVVRLEQFKDAISDLV